jgi:NitT/TauT family transport system ATP-binding protein
MGAGTATIPEGYAMDMSTTVLDVRPALARPIVLEADRVEKTYPNGTHALDGTSVQIGRGEFVSLLGPSGCGKSTLLKMFAGLEAPTAGRIVLHDGAAAAGDAAAQRSMAMVFQEATLMPWARVTENVRLPLDLAGMPRERSEPRIREALELVGLAQFSNAYPRELSGGMQMRASIARALAVQPSILLMDEPFGALDEFTRERLNVELLRIVGEFGTTTIFVTHNIAEAIFLADDVYVMTPRPGRIARVIEVPLERPRTLAIQTSPEFNRVVEEARAVLGAL